MGVGKPEGVKLDWGRGVKSWLGLPTADRVAYLSRCRPWRTAFGRLDSERWDGPQPWASAKCITSSVLSSRAWNAFVPRLLKRSSPKSYFINL